MLIETIGWISAIFMGMILGLMGGGGSILTLPILVYLFKIEPILATSYSLFAVGLGAFVGSLSYMKKGLLDYKTAILFAIPSFIAIFFSRHFILPLLPETLFKLDSPQTGEAILFALTLIIGIAIASFSLHRYTLNPNSEFKRILALMIPAGIMVFSIRQFIIPNLPNSILTLGHFELHKSNALMIFFAIVMLLAAVGMLKVRPNPTEDSNKFSIGKIFIRGLIIGSLTGLVGAGGGFLIIPALVIMVGMEIKKAVGTSLLIITVSSFFGFMGDISHQDIDWKFLLTFSGLALIGIVTGSSLSNKVNGNQLKKYFAYFIIIMGIITLAKEIL